MQSVRPRLKTVPAEPAVRVGPTLHPPSPTTLEAAHIERLPTEILYDIVSRVVDDGMTYGHLGAVSLPVRRCVLDCAMHRVTVAATPKAPVQPVLPQGQWLNLARASSWLDTVVKVQKTLSDPAPHPGNVVSRTSPVSRIALCQEAQTLVPSYRRTLNRLGPQALWVALMPTLKAQSTVGLGRGAAEAAERIVAAYRTGAALLDLSGLNLVDLPIEVGLLTQVQSLRLESNALLSIPDAVGDMTGLKHLWLGNNRLTDLPKSLARLPHLRTLSLFNNDIMLLPFVISQLERLEKLSIDFNQLTQLPEALAHLPELKKLTLDDYLYYAAPEGLIDSLTRRGVCIER